MSQSQITKKQRELTKLRVTEEEVMRNQEPQKLGSETLAVIPGQEHDVLVMFVAQQALAQLENATRTKNRLIGLVNAYGIPQDSDEVKELEKYAAMFEADFEHTKKVCEKEVAKHPLAEKICKIKGISYYQLGLVMALMRYPERFASFGRLAVWAGVTAKYGLHVSKRNINKINQIKHEEYVGNEDEFTKFGYKTTLQQRLYIIVDSLMKQKGWFYDFYLSQRARLTQAAKNDGRAELVGEKWMMVGRNKQSLDAWANSNARWRMARTFLQFVYEEWMLIRGLTPREPYVFEYLGHTSKITLDYVLRWEAKQKSNKGQREDETDQELM